MFCGKEPKIFLRLFSNMAHFQKKKNPAKRNGLLCIRMGGLLLLRSAGANLSVFEFSGVLLALFVILALDIKLPNYLLIFRHIFFSPNLNINTPCLEDFRYVAPCRLKGNWGRKYSAVNLCVYVLPRCRVVQSTLPLRTIGGLSSPLKKTDRVVKSSVTAANCPIC